MHPSCDVWHLSCAVHTWPQPPVWGVELTCWPYNAGGGGALIFVPVVLGRVADAPLEPFLGLSVCFNLSPAQAGLGQPSDIEAQ